MLLFSKKRTVTVVAGAAFIALAVVGCGRSDAPGSTAAAITVDDSPAVGSVTLWAPDGDATALDETLASFKEANPDLEVEVTRIPSDEYTTKLQAAVASGTAPDIMQTYTEAQTSMLDTEVLQPVPEGLVDPGVFFAGSWDAGVVGDVAYTVPWYAYTYALVYRDDFAQAAGAEAPTTWDETVPFFQALQKGGAEFGLGADVGWDVFNGYVLAYSTWQAGGDVIDADNTGWTLDDGAFQSAVEHYASYFSSGVASPDGPGFLDSIPYFVQGKTGAMITGPWVLASFDSVAGEDGWMDGHVKTVPLPAGSGGSAGPLGGGSWGVSAESQNADAAWKVIRYLSQPDTQLAQYAAYGSLPAVQSAWQDDAIAGQPLLDAFFAQLQNTRSYPKATTWNQVATQMGVEMEAVVRGTETADEATANLQAFAEGLGTK